MSNDNPSQPPTHPGWTQYGQYPQQPPPRPPTPARQSRVGWIIVASVGGVLVLCCVGALVLTNATGSSIFSNVNTGPLQQPSPTATAPLPPTLVLTPHIITGPTLGGAVNGFTQRYGLPMDPADNTGGVWSQLTIAGQQVMLIMSAAPIKYSKDGQPHIYVLSVQAPSGVTWGSSTQQSLMAVFLPSDAKFERQQPTDNGYERIYRSAQLAATFTPDLFTNDSGTQTVAPGTLYEGCNLGTAPVQAGGVANSCTVSVGVFS